MKRLIVTAGMPRSGSTWLYNASRLILSIVENIDLGCGWIADFNDFKNHDTVLLKIHDFEPVIATNASIVVYSFRDIRDVLASCKRKFDMVPSMALAKKYMENDKKWREKASFIMRYEDMLEGSENMIFFLSKVLGIQTVNPCVIAQSLKNMTYESGDKENSMYNSENLLHKNHIIDGRHGSWKGHISEEPVLELEHEYVDWMTTNRYL